MVAMVLVNCEEKNLQSKLKNNNYKFKITFHFLLCFQFFIINLFFFVGITSICSSPFSCIKFPKFENRNENWTGEIKPILFFFFGWYFLCISFIFLQSSSSKSFNKFKILERNNNWIVRDYSSYSQYIHLSYPTKKCLF